MSVLELYDLLDKLPRLTLQWFVPCRTSSDFGRGRYLIAIERNCVPCLRKLAMRFISTAFADAQKLTKPMFAASSACHVIASSVLLDSRPAMWARFRSALNLFNALGRVGIMVTKLIKFVASESFMPWALMLIASFGRTVTTGDLVAAV